MSGPKCFESDESPYTYESPQPPPPPPPNQPVILTLQPIVLRLAEKMPTLMRMRLREMLLEPPAQREALREWSQVTERQLVSTKTIELSGETLDVLRQFLPEEQVQRIRQHRLKVRLDTRTFELSFEAASIELCSVPPADLVQAQTLAEQAQVQLQKELIAQHRDMEFGFMVEATTRVLGERGTVRPDITSPTVRSVTLLVFNSQ